MDESRRSVRVATRILAAIEGIDAEPSPYVGNVSATGAYFETTGDPGDIGAVHWIRLASLDKTRSMRLMAHVARRVALDDTDGRRWGVAFEFMPESEAKREQIRDFVMHALEGGEEGETRSVAPRLGAQAIPTRDGVDPGASVKRLTVRSFTLETSWHVAQGETVRAEISAPGIARPISVRGRANKVVALGERGPGQRFVVEVEVQEEVDGPVRRRSSTTFRAVRPEEAAERVTPAATDDTLDDLLSALVLSPAVEQERKTPRHMSGQLGRVRISALCALFDMERMSGELRLERDGAEATIFLRDGEIVDVEPGVAGVSPRDVLRGVLAWNEGTFEFRMSAVTRPNVVNVGTTALLLDLAREDDEASR